jgi:hypothetical protein
VENVVEDAPLSAKGAYSLPDEQPAVVEAAGDLIEDQPLTSKGAYSLPDEQPVAAANPLDDTPLQSKGAYNLPDEFPPEMSMPGAGIEDAPLAAKGAYNLPDEQPSAVVEEKKDDGPLETRLASKQWKTRAQAFEEYKVLVASDSPDPLPDFLPAFISDTNPSS